MSRNGYPTKSCSNVAATSHVTYSRTLPDIDWLKLKAIRLVLIHIGTKDFIMNWI